MGCSKTRFTPGDKVKWVLDNHTDIPKGMVGWVTSATCDFVNWYTPCGKFFQTFGYDMNSLEVVLTKALGTKTIDWSRDICAGHRKHPYDYLGPVSGGKGLHAVKHRVASAQAVVIVDGGGFSTNYVSVEPLIMNTPLLVTVPEYWLLTYMSTRNNKAHTVIFHSRHSAYEECPPYCKELEITHVPSKELEV